MTEPLLTKAQMATVEKMAKAEHPFSAIAKAVRVSVAKLYRAYPGGARVILGKDPYAPRTAPTVRPSKKAPKKVAKKAAKKTTKKAGKKSEW